MDSFLESDEENQSEIEMDIEDVHDDGMESFDEDPSENDHDANQQQQDDNNDDEEDEDDTNYNFTLDDIDWNAVAKEQGDNVQIIPSADKNTPPLLLKKLRRVCNKALLTQKLNELQSKTKNLPWFELLTVSTKQSSSSSNDTNTNKNKNLNPKKLKNNDIKREIFFYQNTLNAVKTAVHRIITEVPNGEQIIQRPNDFYAEMIKSDDHMRKIKGRILWEQKKIGIVENRKKNKRLKRYHKQLMSNKIKENALKIKSERDEIEAWKTNTNRDDRTLQQIMKDARSDYVAKMSVKGKHKPNMKRIMKNLKYGSGYIQRGLKGKNKHRNTFSSTNAFQGDWKRSKQAERRDMKQKGGNKSFARGSKRFNSAQKQKKMGKGDHNGYNKNVKRQRGILGKKQKRGSGKRPGKSVRKKMYRNKAGK